MTRPTAQITSPMLAVLGGLAIVATLHLAQAILVPIALAALVSLMLTPVVSRLEKWGLGPITAVVVVTSFSFVALLAFAWMLTFQVSDLAEKLPQYRQNIVDKTASLGPAGEYVARAYTALHRLGEEMVLSTKAAASDPAAPQTPSVRIVEPGMTPFQVISGLAISVLSTFGAAAVVFILIAFLLVYRRDLGDRIVQVFGLARVNVTNQTMSEAAENVSGYLLMQTVVNFSFGIVLTGLFLVLGVPNALLWGLLAAILRFVPYVGFWIAIVLPVLLSLAVFEGWTRPLILFGSAVVLDTVIGNVIEPWVYGKRTVVSPLGVVCGALFWTWLWGPAGLILAVPMTVSAVVLGKALPQLSFLNTLFGKATALEPRAQLYHRLLGVDADPAADLVEGYAKDKSLVEVCDTLLIPALALAEIDRHASNLDDDRAANLITNVRALIEGLDEPQGPDAHRDAPSGSPALPAPPSAGFRVILIPAADEADEAVALLLAKCLAEVGVKAESTWARTTSGEKVAFASDESGAVICISALPPGASTPARYLAKRIRARNPGAKIVIGRWGSAADAERVVRGGDVVVVATIADAVTQIRTLASTPPAPAREIQPVGSAAAETR